MLGFCSKWATARCLGELGSSWANAWGMLEVLEVRQTPVIGRLEAGIGSFA